MCRKDAEALARRTCEVLFSLEEVIGDPREIHPQVLPGFKSESSFLFSVHQLYLQENPCTQ